MLFTELNQKDFAPKMSRQKPFPAGFPFKRIASYYCFYFGIVGALTPYWGLYLESIQYSPMQIGVISALLMGSKIIAPYIWGALGDALGRKMRIVRLAGLATTVAFCGMLWDTAFAWVAAVTVIYGFFWNAALPQFEANTLNHLGTQSNHYSRVRLWGSVGFILAVVGEGYILDHQPTAVLLIIVLGLMAATWFSSLFVPEGRCLKDGAPQAPVSRTLMQPQVLAFFFACLLMQLSHGPYYTFYSIYLESYQYSRTAIGLLWSLGVVAEIVLFLFVARLLERFGVRTLLLASFLLAVVRWVLTARFPDNIAIVLIAQSLHAATFGLFHAASIAFIHRHFGGSSQGRGQALYSIFSFGIGGAVGGVLSGYIWSQFSPAMSFYAAAAAVSVGFVVLWIFLAPDVAVVTRRGASVE